MAKSYFESNCYQRKEYINTHASRKRAIFNDKRLFPVMVDIVNKMQETTQVAVHQLASTPAELKCYYRFLDNKRVEIEELIKMNCDVKSETIKGKPILIVGDTVSWNMKKSKIKDKSQLGVLNDGTTPGFHTHTHLALTEEGNILGIADMIHWTRDKKVRRVTQKESRKKSYEEKESYRWALGATNASELTQLASRRTFLFDQEGDHFELLQHITKQLNDHLIIRSNFNRPVIWNGEKMKVNHCLEQSKSLGSYLFNLPKLNHYSRTKGKRVLRKARKAKMTLRSEKVDLLPPYDKKDQAPISLYVVEARETGNNIPTDESPILWRIWTTHPVTTFEEAKQIIYYYTLRWIIEQLFRTLKKKGFKVESTELESFEGVLKQTTMAMNAAAKVLQLVYARNRMDCQPTSDVFDKKEQQILQKVNERMEGKTEKQKNHFPPDKLSWAAWIIARLGGWKGYASQRPPGPITMKRGLEKFFNYKEAFEIMNTD